MTHVCGSTSYPCDGSTDPSWYFCPADFNCDRFVDFFDYLDYLDAFEAGDLRSDINGDEFLDFFDYSEFVRRFEQGC